MERTWGSIAVGGLTRLGLLTWRIELVCWGRGNETHLPVSWCVPGVSLPPMCLQRHHSPSSAQGTVVVPWSILSPLILSILQLCRWGVLWSLSTSLLEHSHWPLLPFISLSRCSELDPSSQEGKIRLLQPQPWHHTFHFLFLMKEDGSLLFTSVTHCLPLFGHFSFVFKESHLQGRQLRSILVSLLSLIVTVNSLVLKTVANSRVDLLINYSVLLIMIIIILIILDTLVIVQYLVVIIIKFFHVDLCSSHFQTTSWPPHRPTLPTSSSEHYLDTDPQPHFSLVSSLVV